MGTVIEAIAKSVPDNIVSNLMLAQYMETSDDWIRQRSGIVERRWARDGNSSCGKTTSLAMSVDATKQVLETAGRSANEVDAIVYATISADNDLPGNSVGLLHSIGSTRQIPVFEVRNHCTGFLYGLSIAHAYLATNACDLILLLGFELQSTGLNLTNSGRDTAVLFGDGGGAALLSRGGDERGIISICLESDGSYADKLGVESPGFARSCYIEPADFEESANKVYPRMEGRLIFKMASQKMPEMVRKAVKQAGLSLGDLKLIVPHQANQRIIDMLEAELAPCCPVFSNIAKYGNTTAGTIPLALAEAQQQGILIPGDLVCLVSFGAGFSWGAVVLRW
ncbi:MAG: ketoacyl-ACP synthase III [Bdellovibrionales bacterium]|nr:ketoacyl-ACP synthase III [Bdellovibrionales bacterium]